MATVDEAIQLIKNNFYENATEIIEMQTQIIVRDGSYITSKFEQSFHVMGNYNQNNTSTISSTAYFEDAQGDLGYISMKDYLLGQEYQGHDTISVGFNQEDNVNFRRFVNNTSTLLVKGTSTATTTQVSEPASIFVFILGIMALAVRHFSQAKTALIK